MVCGIQPNKVDCTGYGSIADDFGKFAKGVSQHCGTGSSSAGVVQTLGEIKGELCKLGNSIDKLTEMFSARRGHVCGGGGRSGGSGAGQGGDWSNTLSDLKQQLGSLSDTLQGLCGGGQVGYASGQVATGSGGNYHASYGDTYQGPVQPRGCGPSDGPCWPVQPVAPEKPDVPGKVCETPSPKKSHCDDDKWSASEVKDGKGEIKLGKDYTLKFDESKMEFTLINNCTGEKTRVWGDPHVDQGADGKDDWNFKKDTTFKLADGTKITVDTVDGCGNQVDKSTTGPSYASKLTITKGDNAIVVSGLAGGIDGQNNVSVTVSGNGVALDDKTDDGTVVTEKPGGWSLDGHYIDQKGIDDAEAGKHWAVL